ncbi:carbohydrate sulfotransferase 7 isoform X2 [Anolis carolinensis]|uniref:carbohydrate sulfotransferase 7 isoform X2 n=3 Tax=Anolis carolinensis TaxID=28377 RepID=UPI002F2B31FF
MPRRRRWQPPRRRRWALGLALYTLLVLLLASLVGRGGKGEGGEEEGGGASPRVSRRCPSPEAALGEWGWGEELEDEGAAGNGTANGSLAVERAPSGRRQLYLHATWRTGSSFVGELFNQHPGAFYLYEPMWHLWQALYPGDARSLQGALRDMLGALFRCDFSVLRLYSPPPSSSSSSANLSTASLFGWRTNKAICSPPLCPGAALPRASVGLVDGAACERLCPPRALRDLEAECRKAPLVVVKDVRLLDLSALAPLLRDPGLDLRVVQLFRDPRAVHNSRLRAKRALLRESLQVVRSRRGPGLADAFPPRQQQQPRAEALLSGALEVICQGWLRDLRLQRAAPPPLRARLARLRYEDLVRDPRGQLRRLLRFAGLPSPPALEAFALDMTRGRAPAPDAPPAPFLVSARDARHALRAWKERLSRAQVRQVERACAPAMRLLGYPLSREDEAGQQSEPSLKATKLHAYPFAELKEMLCCVVTLASQQVN